MSKQLNPTTLLAPVPVVMVSCALPDGKPNIVTVAWIGTVCSKPPMVSISLKPERFSHGLIQSTGEFVVNLVDRQLVKAADYCGVRSGRDVDKFAVNRLTAFPADGLDHAPLIAESPVSLSCKVRQVLQLGSHDLFLAEIVAVRVQDQLLDATGALHMDQANLVCYNHGKYQLVGDTLGFFGYAVAKPEVYRKRMNDIRK